MTLWQTLSEAITQATGSPFTPADRRAAGGGCINEATVLQGTDGRRFFVKLNRPELAEMFAAEAEGLHALREPGAIRVPEPLCHGTAAGRAYLVMEHIPLGGPRDARRFGEQLARLHQCTRERFGWHRDNTIGSTPQINTWESDWVTFWRQHRLGYQLERARRQGGGRGLVQAVEALMEVLPAFFDGYTPRPSLLHGDLWGGNQDADAQGNPVIFDPAVYFGDREADVAMTELFGGFGPDFYAAYDAVWPRDPGYRVRRDLYNLYHLLNHFNLFGGGYAGQSERLARRLLAAARGG
ncbi:fructosamine kinase family protein [Ectothiorhodospira mobilis]|uniref:fructosamine kinase family protein n=1 Tax=Ectothiorhodospira mobilis TaxID=195064 RepID=UPI001EE8C998|nr:fructosamine kinase family protein [Ectothiorhodospira mobilis]MCG5534620.1 fructosamine kinase family protein [Ectothiorhodospira mobilis]